ncbi:glycosyltransferase family 4 protein [Pleomorphovibrio marinus]|uniref:glycosyltransferase family 4 protein n=1 Tax=Pleomorphovibrio marinus TaxID=2164132 RepID=UPI000E09EE49|nr:glycosyltransferase family 4 protein [Pleomorphovibrio marinus]
MAKINDRKIVIINQASNYLTIGFANAFFKKFEDVTLITGSIRVQGEALNPGINVHPIHRWVERPAHKKLVSYLRALWRFAWLIRTKYRYHEVFFVSVPPMGYLLNLILPNRFSMVIWDVYPDTFKITGMKESHPLYRVWSRLNRRSFKKAFRLFTIGDKMAELLGQYVDRDSILIQPIWSIFQENTRVSKSKNPFVKEHGLEGKFVVQYSGNIGLTHRVEYLVQLAEKMKDHSHILFQIIGRGPRKSVLEKLVREKELPNCQFLPFQSEVIFPYSLSASDLGVVILDETISKGSVPSKSYNLMSFGIPSLYIADTDSELSIYAKKFGHAACFKEKDLGQAEAFILELSQNRKLWEQHSKNAEIASSHFRRKNADKFVALYISHESYPSTFPGN